METKNDTLGITLPVDVWQKLFRIANQRKQGINETIEQLIHHAAAKSTKLPEKVPTKRQQEYREQCKVTYDLVASGKTIEEVAEELDIHASTVRKHYRNHSRIVSYQESLVDNSATIA